jgi:hypothetical protein
MSGNTPFAEMAALITRALPAMRKIADNNKPPFIAGIYTDAYVRIIFR